MPGLGGPFGGGLGADDAVINHVVTPEEAKAILVSLFPPGELYDFDNPDTDIYKLMLAFGAAAKRYAFDVADRLHTEFNPAAALEKLPDWETALDIIPGTGNNTADKSSEARRNGIVGKLREFGASTIYNIQSAIAPLLGYVNPAQLVVLEVDRNVMRSAHTYLDTAGGGTLTVPTFSSLTRTIYVNDDGIASAGVFIHLNITAVDGGNITARLTSPTGQTKFFQSFASGTVTNQSYELYARNEFISSKVNGYWTLQLFNADFVNTCGWQAGNVFIEGLGGGGLGQDLHVYGVFADATLVNAPDYAAALAALTRVTPANTKAYLILSNAPYPDNITGAHLAIPDQCIPV
jgi:hypothetical protein